MAESILQGGKEDLAIIKSMIEKQDLDRKRAEELSKIMNGLTKEIELKKKAMNSEIDSTMKARQAEIENTYNKEIVELNKSKKKVQSDKAKEKSVKVSERVGAETEEMKEKVKTLKKEINSRVREYRLPVICKYRLFYALFMPRTLADIFLLIISFMVLFLILPGVVFTLLDGKPFGPTFTPAIVYVIDIMLFGGAYMLINNLVKDKHDREVKGISELLGEIRQNKKAIRLVTRGIQKDTDESEYGLEAYDRELAEMEAKLSDLTNDEKAALESFNNDTKPLLTGEIKGRYEPDIATLQKEFEACAGEHKALAESLRHEALNLSANYETQIGKNNMTVEVMDRLLAIMEEGKAITIGDALNVLKSESTK